MKKKIAAMILSTAMAASLLAGCGGNDAGNAQESGSAAADAASETEAEPETEEAADTDQEEAGGESAAPTETRTIKILSMWPEDDADSTANGSIIKLPYWNDGNGDTGWVSNGANGVWKSWQTIRTEDIKEFLKVEKW